jgi:hypothetical protein
MFHAFSPPKSKKVFHGNVEINSVAKLKRIKDQSLKLGFYHYIEMLSCQCWTLLLEISFVSKTDTHKMKLHELWKLTRAQFPLCGTNSNRLVHNDSWAISLHLVPPTSELNRFRINHCSRIHGLRRIETGAKFGFKDASRFLLQKRDDRMRV